MRPSVYGFRQRVRASLFATQAVLPPALGSHVGGGHASTAGAHALPARIGHGLGRSQAPADRLVVIGNDIFPITRLPGDPAPFSEQVGFGSGDLATHLELAGLDADPPFMTVPACAKVADIVAAGDYRLEPPLELLDEQPEALDADADRDGGGVEADPTAGHDDVAALLESLAEHQDALGSFDRHRFDRVRAAADEHGSVAGVLYGILPDGGGLLLDGFHRVAIAHEGRQECLEGVGIVTRFRADPEEP